MGKPIQENRRIQRPFWYVVGVTTLAWLILGATIPREGTSLNDLFNIAAVGAFLSALLFVAVYTIAGFVGPEPRPRWWQNEVGTYLVLALIARLVIVGPTTFAVAFNDGMINTWWWAWIWIGGHLLGGIMVFALVWLFIRNTYYRVREA